MKSIKFVLTVFCAFLVSMAFGQNGSKQANFQSLQVNQATLQKLNTQNINSDVPLSAEQQAIRAQRQANRANQTFQTRANPQVNNNQNVQAPANSIGGSINVKTSVNNPNGTFTPTNVQLTQAQRKAKIKALIEQIKNQ